MIVGNKILFPQRERVLVLLVKPGSDGLACMMLNIKMDIECVYLHLPISFRQPYWYNGKKCLLEVAVALRQLNPSIKRGHKVFSLKKVLIPILAEKNLRYVSWLLITSLKSCFITFAISPLFLQYLYWY